MTEFTFHLAERMRAAGAALETARASGDDFGSSLWETDLEELRQLARAYGVTVPAS